MSYKIKKGSVEMTILDDESMRSISKSFDSIEDAYEYLATYLNLGDDNNDK